MSFMQKIIVKMTKVKMDIALGFLKKINRKEF